MKKEVWITRSKNSIVKNDDNFITIWLDKPIRDENFGSDKIEYYGYGDYSIFKTMALGSFKNIFRINLKKGECKKVMMDYNLMEME